MCYSLRYGVVALTSKSVSLLLVHPYLAHFALTVSRQEGHVVDLIHDNKVLLLPLKVLQHIEHKKYVTSNRLTDRKKILK